jgi:hypothetical protein
VTRSKAFDPAENGRAGDAFVLQQLDNGSIQRTAVPGGSFADKDSQELSNRERRHRISLEEHYPGTVQRIFESRPVPHFRSDIRFEFFALRSLSPVAHARRERGE